MYVSEYTVCVCIQYHYVYDFILVHFSLGSSSAGISEHCGDLCFLVCEHLYAGVCLYPRYVSNYHPQYPAG